MAAVRIKASQVDSGGAIASETSEPDRLDGTTTASGLCGWTRQGLLTVSGDRAHKWVTTIHTVEHQP